MANLIQVKQYGYQQDPGSGIVTQTPTYPYRYVGAQVVGTVSSYVDSQNGPAAGSKIVFSESAINGGMDYAWIVAEPPSVIQSRLNAALS